jgi:EAL domain-containing protein (putative c-di-GMP-specific phosphodiesterase class I)
VGGECGRVGRSVVGTGATEPNARAVLMAMATFAWQTGSFVIAEGIEDQDTLTFLRQIDHLGLRAGHVIQGGQGYGLGRPSSALAAERPSLLDPTLAPAEDVPAPAEEVPTA